MIQEDKSATFFRFEDLRVYSKAISFVNVIARSSILATNDIENHFYKVFLEEATMIAVNIAEGSTKNKNTFISFLKVVKTNIRKCLVMSTIGRQNDYLNEDSENIIRTQLIELTKMVGALIISLQKNSNNSDYNSNNNHNQNDIESENITW